MKDVAIVGLGPAGRALASACAARGLSVLAVDPRPGAAWTPTYGAWTEELVGLPPGVVRQRIEVPELWARGRHRLPRAYAVLDNAALQAALPLDGVELREARLDDAGVSGLAAEARVVVDARGARPAGRRPQDPAPAQTAYGIVVDRADAAPALAGAEGILMDWSTDWSEAPDSPRGVPSFLYALPLDEDRVLLEETCLAASPALGVPALRERLRRRLLRRGVRAGAVEDPLARETVWIPMRGRDEPAPPDTLAVGTAGRGGHLVTGYSVAHSLRSARSLADRLAAGEAPSVADPARPGDLLRQAGLRALLRLDTAGTVALFEAFGTLPVHRQRAVMARDAGSGSLGAAMWGMFAAMPPAGRAALVRATLGPARRPPDTRA
ncbi:lycopene cyclase family protein [Serinicoccus chungangensis]|uniref:lycopene cyclase family protein n=1 Tax=Serinicoccus chungangensis TaxID=767452 RepID=UPI00111A747B|nr:lycopene cyclase family protein [Serinicoccus chungangensis]